MTSIPVFSLPKTLALVNLMSKHDANWFPFELLGTEKKFAINIKGRRILNLLFIQALIGK
jgi:hypothetical protein